jgi:glutathione S-transferase
MYKLYWSKSSGAFAPQVMLEEAGVAYEKVVVDLDSDAQRAPEFVAINPLGQVPVLELPDGTVLTESAAIVLEIGDRHPESGLLPAVGSSERAVVVRWLIFMAVNLYVAELRTFYSDRFTTDPNGAEGVRASGLADAGRYLTMLEEALAPGPFLLGERCSAADIYLFMLSSWFPVEMLEKYPRILGLATRVRARPAVARLLPEHELLD